MRGAVTFSELPAAARFQIVILGPVLVGAICGFLLGESAPGWWIAQAAGDLSAIASVGSAVALMIFLLVGAAGYRRRADTGSNAVIVVLAMAVTAIVLVFFAVDTLQNAPETFIAIIGIALLAIILDALVRRGRPDRPSPQPPSEQPAASPSG
jgi:hypothetical protein